MLTGTGPLGGPLPTCGMVFPAAPPAAPTSPSADGTASFTVAFSDAFAALVAGMQGESTQGAALAAATTPVDQALAGGEAEPADAEDVEAAIVFAFTPPPQELAPVTTSMATASPVETAPAEPTRSEPTRSELALSEPALPATQLPEAALSGSALSEPALSEPALSEPALSEPALSAAIAPPVTALPAATIPPATQLAVAFQPAAANVVGEPASREAAEPASREAAEPASREAAAASLDPASVEHATRSQPARVVDIAAQPARTGPARATDIPTTAGAPVPSAPTGDGHPLDREMFSPAESPAPVDRRDDTRLTGAARQAADAATAAREIELRSAVTPAATPPAAPAAGGAPAANTPAPDAKPAGSRVGADLVASAQVDGVTAEAVTSGAALDDGQGSNTETAGSPPDGEFTYTAPAGPPRRFGRVEDMVRELDRQAAESPATARPVPSDARAVVLRTAAPVVAPQASTPMALEPPPENLAALVQGIRIQLRQGISEATVRLQPEHFGEVTIAVRLERGTVSAQVHAEAAGVCDWLSSQEESIRNSLSEHGLHLERFVVQRDRPRERREAPPQPNRPKARQGTGTDQPRFEVAA